MTLRRRKTGGHNHVLISGLVESRVITGTTGDGEEACSFSVSSGEPGQKNAHIRVNAYGSIAGQCVSEAVIDGYCVIVGELMNRPGKFGNLTEVRAKKVEFFSSVEERDGNSDG